MRQPGAFRSPAGSLTASINPAATVSRFEAASIAVCSVSAALAAAVSAVSRSASAASGLLLPHRAPPARQHVSSSLVALSSAASRFRHRGLRRRDRIARSGEIGLG
jgi:hypothetical protein